MTRSKILYSPPGLMDAFHIKIRFSEVDSMQIVWHGSYVKYLEDGRESFGRRFGIGYADICRRGYTVPLVALNCEYKLPLRYGDEAIVETHFINSEAAKIMFEYCIFRKDDHALAMIASSTQIFLNRNNEMELYTPVFFQDWKRKWNII